MKIWIFILVLSRSCAVCLASQSCPTIYHPMDCSLARLLIPWEFSRQEYWSGLPFSSSEDLPDPGIEPQSPTLQADSLPSEPPGKPVSTLQRPISPFSFPLSLLFGILAHFPQGFPFIHIILSSIFDLIFTASSVI